ncbi:unnamed protein product [Camellia sinensis]
MRIEGCDKLVDVIPSDMLPRLQNLTELSVQYCPMVEEILSEKEEEKVDAEAKENIILFPQLKTLELGYLENLESFCTSRLPAQHFFKHLKIKNPNYQRKWKTPMIDNPEFKDDHEIYVFPKLKYVGIELWQVKSGTLFDNVLICDDPDYAMKLAEETWGKQKYAEKAAFDEVEKKREEEDLKRESKDDPVDSDAEGDDDETDKDADITEESAHDEL